MCAITSAGSRARASSPELARSSSRPTQTPTATPAVRGVPTIVNHYGCWDAALIDAGLRPFKPVTVDPATGRATQCASPNEIDPEDMAEGIREARRAMGEPFNSKSYIAYRSQQGHIARSGRRLAGYVSIWKRFGSWATAMAYAPHHPRKSRPSDGRKRMAGVLGGLLILLAVPLITLAPGIETGPRKLETIENWRPSGGLFGQFQKGADLQVIIAGETGGKLATNTRYLMLSYTWNIGRYIERTMNPMMQPTTAIMIGSSTEVSAFTDASTCSS